MHGFVVATGRYQPNLTQHLPHRQAPGHALPELVIGAQTLTNGGYLRS